MSGDWRQANAVPAVTATESKCNGESLWFVGLHGVEFTLRLTPDDADELAEQLKVRAKGVREMGAGL